MDSRRCRWAFDLCVPGVQQTYNTFGHVRALISRSINCLAHPLQYPAGAHPQSYERGQCACSLPWRLVVELPQCVRRQNRRADCTNARRMVDKYMCMSIGAASARRVDIKGSYAECYENAFQGGEVSAAPERVRKCLDCQILSNIMRLRLSMRVFLQERWSTE
jgi:hypothetical protein